MTRALLHHFLWFGAGLSVTAFLLRTDPGNDPVVETASAARDGGDMPAVTAPARIAVVDDAPASSDSNPREWASARIKAALQTIRNCGEQERAARWALLLAQLKQKGDAGIAAMAEFLASGEDLPLGPRLETAGIKLSGPTTLRMAVLDQLANSQDPAVRELRRKEALRSLQMTDNLSDAYRYIRTLEYEERGRHRDEAVAAILRTAGNPGRGNRKDDLTIIGEVLTHFGAIELLPISEARALEQPEQRLDDLFGILWKVPAEHRRAVTDRLLSNPSLHSRMDGAALMPKLDFQLPAARDYAMAWFNTRPSIAARATALEHLASDRRWTAGFSYPGDSWKSDRSVGTPGTPAQAEARLAFLDQVEPLLSEPLLREKLAQARLSLQKQIDGKR